MSRLGLIFAGAPSVPEMVAISQRAEERGFDSVWVAETRMTRDGFVPLAAIGQATARIGIGTGIVNVYTRNPVVLAISFLALAEVAPGRVSMGLGTGSPGVLAPQGIAFERPLTRLREYCDVVPRLVRGEEVTYRGETVTLEGARVEDLLSSEGGPQGRLPLVLGVTGPKALGLAGEVADGVMLNICLGPDYVERRLPLIEEGARRAGRSRAEIDVSMVVVCSPDEDSALGKRRAAAFVALYLSLFPNIAKETGLDAELVEATRAAFHAGGLDAAMAAMGTGPVDRLTVAGTPAECHERLDAYRAAGVDLPILVPVEGTVDAVLALSR